MTRKFVPALILAIVASSAACRSSSPAISEVRAAMLESWNRGDVESLMSHYSPDAVILMEGVVVRGIDEIRVASAAGIEAGTRMDMLTPISTWVDGDLAVIHATWASTTPAVDRAMKDGGHAVVVLRRQSDSTWRVELESWSRSSRQSK